MGRANNFKDLTGYKFNRLTVMRKNGMKYRRAVWLCQCLCGNIIETRSNGLTSGRTQSCGCLGSGFKPNKPGIVYYLRVIERNTGNHYFKVGITNRQDINDRIREMLTDLVEIQALQVFRFENGADARTIEQKILEDHSAYRAKGLKILANGNTELLTKDVSDRFQEYGLN